MGDATRTVNVMEPEHAPPQAIAKATASAMSRKSQLHQNLTVELTKETMHWGGADATRAANVTEPEHAPPQAIAKATASAMSRKSQLLQNLTVELTKETMHWGGAD